MQSMAIIVRDDTYDRLLTPFAFAHAQASAGVQVDILFVLWAVRVLTPDGVSAPLIAGPHAGDEQWLRDRLGDEGGPVEILDWLRLLKATGNVSLFGCKLAAGTFEVTAQDLLPEADGIVHPSWFLIEKAARADHTQYF